MELIVLVAVLGGAFLVYRHVSADGGGPDLAWGGAGVATGAPGARPPYRVDAASTPLSSAAALSRLEARRLRSSPLLWAGVGLTALECLAVLDSGLPDQSEWLSLGGRLLPLLVFPLCGMVVIAANRAALRPRRDGTTELLDTLPARASTRTLGLLLALWAPVLVGAAATVALSVCVWFGAGKSTSSSLWSRSSLDLPYTDIGLANLAVAVVLVLCAGALGIGLARLLPWSFVPLVALVLIGILTGALGRDDLSPAVGALSPLVNAGDLPSFLWPYPTVWHVVYLLGLAVVAAGASFLLDGDRRWGAATLALAATLVATALVGQSRSYAGDTPQQLADLVTEAPDHQRCVENGAARVCVYADLLPVARPWLELATAVRDAAPDEAVAGPLLISQRLSADEIGQLHPEVRSAVEQRGDPFSWLAEPGLHPDLRWVGSDTADSRALQVAHELVGLPEPGSDHDEPCYAGGQARAAVAVALAGRALPADQHRAFSAAAAERYGATVSAALPGDTVTDLAEDEWEVDADPVVVHSETDLILGRALLERPMAQVRAVLADDWDRWIDPTTPSAELADAFGLSVGQAATAPTGMAPCA